MLFRSVEPVCDFEDFGDGELLRFFTTCNLDDETRRSIEEAVAFGVLFSLVDFDGEHFGDGLPNVLFFGWASSFISDSNLSAARSE